MATTQLTTVDEVLDALGGTGVVAELVKKTDAAVSNWRKAGQFPANTYLILRAELKKLDRSAPDSLWSFQLSEAS